VEGFLLFPGSKKWTKTSSLAVERAQIAILHVDRFSERQIAKAYDLAKVQFPAP